MRKALVYTVKDLIHPAIVEAVGPAGIKLEHMRPEEAAKAEGWDFVIFSHNGEPHVLRDAADAPRVKGTFDPVRADKEIVVRASIRCGDAPTVQAMWDEFLARVSEYATKYQEAVDAHKKDEKAKIAYAPETAFGTAPAGPPTFLKVEPGGTPQGAYRASPDAPKSPANCCNVAPGDECQIRSTVTGDVYHVHGVQWPAPRLISEGLDSLQKACAETAIYPEALEAFLRRVASEAVDVILHELRNQPGGFYPFNAKERAVMEGCLIKVLQDKVLPLLKLCYVGLGLAGEAGELANKIKKVIRDKGCVLDKTTAAPVARELEGVLWYAPMVALELGDTLGHVGVEMLNTLRGRKDRGTLRGDGDAR